jgi:flagellar hook assembly protein FlgD
MIFRAYNSIYFKLFLVFTLAVILAPSRSNAGSQSLGSVNLLSVTPRIITPNAPNHVNNAAFFNFDQPLDGQPVTGDIYDVSGAHVSTFGVFCGVNGCKQMSWGGTDGDGRVVPSGIYIYQIKLNGARVNGSVVVAR